MCNYVGDENKMTLVLLQSEKKNLCFPVFKVLEKVEENTEHENFIFLLLMLLLSLLLFARQWGRSVSFSLNETSGLAEGLLNSEDGFFQNKNELFFKKKSDERTQK